MGDQLVYGRGFQAKARLLALFKKRGFRDFSGTEMAWVVGEGDWVTVSGTGEVRFQNKGVLLLRQRRAVSSLGNTRPSPSFDRVARQQSPTGGEGMG